MDITTKFIQDIFCLENTISLFNEKYIIDKSIFNHELQCNLQMFCKKITYLERMWSRVLAGELSYSNCLDNINETSSNKLETTAYKTPVTDKLNRTNLTNTADEFQSFPLNKNTINVPELDKNQLAFPHAKICFTELSSSQIQQEGQIKSNVTVENAVLTSHAQSKPAISGSKIVSKNKVNLFPEIIPKDNLIQICNIYYYCLQCSTLLHKSNCTSHISGKKHSGKQQITPLLKSSDLLICLVCNLAFLKSKTFKSHIKKMGHTDRKFLHKDCPKCHIKLFGSLKIINQHEHLTSKSKLEMNDIVKKGNDSENQWNCSENERDIIKSNLEIKSEFKREGVQEVQHKKNDLKQDENNDLGNDSKNEVKLKTTINNIQPKKKCSYTLTEINSLSIYSTSSVANCLLCIVQMSKNDKNILGHINGSRHKKYSENNEFTKLLKPFLNQITQIMENDKDNVFHQNIDFLFPSTTKTVYCILCDCEISNKKCDILLHFKSSQHIQDRKRCIGEI